jgi:hypothetical protein
VYSEESDELKWKNIPFLQLKCDPKVLDTPVKHFLAHMTRVINNDLVAGSNPGFEEYKYSALVNGLKARYSEVYMKWASWDSLVEEINGKGKGKDDHMDAVACACCHTPIIYPKIQSMGTVTGRVTCSSPNESNTPKAVLADPFNMPNDIGFNKLLAKDLGAHLGNNSIYHIDRKEYTLFILEKETGFTMPVARFRNPVIHSVDMSVDEYNHMMKMVTVMFISMVQMGDLSKKSYGTWLRLAKPYLQEYRTYELLTHMVLGAEFMWEKTNLDTDRGDDSVC